MSGLVTVLVMSFCLGAGCFGFGMLPLSFLYPKTYIAKLSTLGTGLLLGTALGVIIPEGMETLASSHPSSELPTHKIALSLLCGFTFMLIVEQFVSPHSHSAAGTTTLPLHTAKPEPNSEVHFDADLGDLEAEQGTGYMQADDLPSIREGAEVDNRQKAYPLTLGLIVHGLADGLALGVSALSTSESGASSDLTLVVFFALIIHKAPTALALTTSLLATSLPRSECRKHIAFFSASTPFGAIVSYGALNFLGAGNEGDWTGVALLISGGTFLYVATVLQPVSHHGQSSEGMSEVVRAAYVIAGMFVPFAIGRLLGGHTHMHGGGPGDAIGVE